MKIKLTSPNNKVLFKSVIAALSSLSIYLLVVIITTPNLPPLAALNAAIRVNWIIIFGFAVTLGSQVYISSYGRRLGCRISNNKKGILGSSGGTAIGSFLSFFSLVPLGCCGTWLLFLSSLPSLFGSSLSVALIQHSKWLSYGGLIVVIGYTIFVYLRLRKQLGEKTRELNEVCDRSH
jgi:hypothetical protein